ncbi:hypothetical protein [Flavivirga eckloniae]|nr:hypothetical protein [Flavivirga eckloniae]
MKVKIILYILLSQTIMAYSQSSSCNSDAHKVVYPFLGEWEEYTIKDSVEVYIGRLITKLDIEGCVLTQTFVMSDTTFSYRSHGYVNPASNIWEETYVFNSGGYSKYLWIAEGKSLYTLRIGGSRKTDYLQRLKYIDIKKDEYTVVQQESYNGGISWKSKDSTKIKRIE